MVTSHYGFVYSQPSQASQTVSDVAAGNRLKWEGTKGAFYKVAYPDGRQGYISKSISMPEKKWRATLKQDAASIIATAHSMMGIPYLWAGTSSKGVDCSGFMRTVLFMHDIIIPRDASQQAYVGEHIDIAPDFSNLQPGDLIFFGRKATPERQGNVWYMSACISVTSVSSIRKAMCASIASAPTTSCSMNTTSVDCCSLRACYLI